MTRSRALASVALVVAAATAGVGVASEERASKSERRALFRPGDPAPQEVLEKATARFAALQTPTRDVPADVREVAETMVPGAVATAHLVAARPAFAFYVLESGGRLCYLQSLRSGARAGGCYVDPGAVASGDVGPSVTKVAGGYRLTALVPDGTDGAELQRVDGTRRALDIADNVLSVEVEQLPERVTWIAPAGARKSFPVGADLFDAP